jgi:S1-C subfamily serine protease
LETFLGVSSDEKKGERHDGVQIDGVTLGGPADHAGLRTGDYILSIDNHYVFTVAELDSDVRGRSGRRSYSRDTTSDYQQLDVREWQRLGFR